VLLRAGGSVEARIVSFEPLAWPTVLWRAGFGGCAFGLSTLQLQPDSLWERHRL